MENPATWGTAEHVVADALRQAEEMRRQGAVGLSVPRQVTDALRERGLLREVPMTVDGDGAPLEG